MSQGHVVRVRVLPMVDFILVRRCSHQSGGKLFAELFVSDILREDDLCDLHELQRGLQLLPQGVRVFTRGPERV
eukprot:CAMPEP_0171142216 /NCGR_PEP_ID=MMETSP0766_2-20121228/142053_1 /TAXON_ID=439317 /ORGANISM="Gambierdiscus australes, Strain CAWD 149" /LENGTH=73 /DNA_ID=CAMNT_0011605995 /DNA_START=41 /DNA_END=259 /DNA_ORIENTATION=-